MATRSRQCPWSSTATCKQKRWSFALPQPPGRFRRLPATVTPRCWRELEALLPAHGQRSPHPPGHGAPCLCCCHVTPLCWEKNEGLCWVPEHFLMGVSLLYLNVVTDGQIYPFTRMCLEPILPLSPQTGASWAVSWIITQMFILLKPAPDLSTAVFMESFVVTLLMELREPHTNPYALSEFLKLYVFAPNLNSYSQLSSDM